MQTMTPPEVSALQSNPIQYTTDRLGQDMGGVRVHAGSAQPAQLQAHAYAQGTDIHLGPGQEQHLPHEAWHVVQQVGGFQRPR
jgi:hypothetical protein